MEIILFSTDIESRSDMERITPFMNHLPGIKQWTLDLNDCDKVLRIVTVVSIANQIELQLRQMGYSCHRMFVPKEITSEQNDWNQRFQSLQDQFQMEGKQSGF